MLITKARWFLIAAFALYSVCAKAGVNLELRPASSIAHAGDTVQVGLYAVSADPFNSKMAAMDVIISHDAGKLGFVNITSAGAPYQWLFSGFMTPTPDGINNNLYDGSMLYSAWSQMGAANAAVATPQGLLVTTFRFTAAAPSNRTYIDILPTWGLSETLVLDGTVPNLRITGALYGAEVRILPNEPFSKTAEVKTLPDGTLVELNGPVVTRTFGNMFYVEDVGRACGIRVDRVSGGYPAEGTIPNIIGEIRTIEGEKVIADAQITTGASAEIPSPLGMNSSALSAGLSPQGLLITMWGRASVPNPMSDEFTISDSPARHVRVKLYGTPAPADGSYVKVTGVLGRDAAGQVIRVNASSPVTALQ